MTDILKSANWTPCEGRFPIIAYTTFRELDEVKEDMMKIVEKCGFSCVLENPYANANDLKNQSLVPETDRYYQNNYLAISRILGSLTDTNLKLLLGGWQLFKELTDKQTGSPINGLDVMRKYTVKINNNDVEKDDGLTYLQILEKYISNYKSQTHLGGWSVTDEPNEKFFDRLKNYCDKIRELDPNHVVLVNLVGGPSEGQMALSKSENNNKDVPYEDKLEAYKRYLDEFVEKINPTVLCYDLYPIQLNDEINLKITEGSTTKNIPVTINSIITDNSIKVGDPRYLSYSVEWRNFYNAFELFSRKVKELRTKNKNVNFWAFVQSLAFANTSFVKPDAQVQFMRYEAFSALAYGAQGILFWTYYHRPSSAAETFMSALVGKKSYLNEVGEVVTEYYRKPEWYYAQKIISEIKDHSNIFLGCRTTCAHSGDFAFFTEATLCEHTGTSFGPLETIYDAYDGDGFLFSDIENNGRHYLMIVNHNPFKAQNIKFKFKNSFTYLNLRFKDIHLSPILPDSSANSTGIISQIVPPGDYLLYSYT
ncbi:MAG: hypothetical protein NC453_19020 [Muribaculum sp.]|nr:hypothetical protein [Muribaculum sp.]